jgi:hypothetical protein
MGGRTRRVCISSGEDFDVYIGRGKYLDKPCGFGNPYTHIKGGTLAGHVVGSRAEAVAMYRRYANEDKGLLERIRGLKGKVLGCWCGKDEECHGDVIIEIAEGESFSLDI